MDKNKSAYHGIRRLFRREILPPDVLDRFVAHGRVAKRKNLLYPGKQGYRETWADSNLNRGFEQEMENIKDNGSKASARVHPR